jgi:predicted TPR repeat methyltransferase
VFLYVGALEEVFAACCVALRPGGLLAFSIEAGDDSSTFILRSSGRYAHATEYIRSLAAKTGLQEVGRRAVFLRHENGKRMTGYIFLFRRPFSLPESAYRIKYFFD